MAPRNSNTNNSSTAGSQAAGAELEPRGPVGNDEEYQAELMGFLQESRDMRKTAKSSLKQGLYAGGGAIAGGMIAGPVGGLVGGIAGSIVGFMKADPYDGAVQQLLKLPAANQSKLVRAVGAVLTRARSTNDPEEDFFESPEVFKRTLVDFASRPHVRQEIWQLCKEAIQDVQDGGGESSPSTVLTE